MNPPAWAIGRDLKAPNAPETYAVRLTDPKLIALVIPKRGKLLLTVRKQRLGTDGQADPVWLQHMDQAAHFWATQNADPSFAKQPPEIAIKSDCEWPRFLLCEGRLGRRLVLHTSAPVVLLEILSQDPPAGPASPCIRVRNLAGECLASHGRFPASAEPLLAEITSLLGWLQIPAPQP